METVLSPDGVAKIVEAEKEVFLCDFRHNIPTKLLDVGLFTEIFEDVADGKVLKKKVEYMSKRYQNTNSSQMWYLIIRFIKILQKQIRTLNDRKHRCRHDKCAIL